MGQQDELVADDRPQLEKRGSVYDDPEDRPLTSRQKAQGFLESATFDAFMIVVLGFNTMLVIIMTDLGTGESADEPLPTWVKAGHITLLSIFSVELTAKLLIYQWPFFYSRLNVFEMTLVVADVGAEILTKAIGDLPSFSVFRIIRVLRLLRAARLMRSNRELMVMMHGFISTFKAVFWCLVLLCLAILSWAILAVEVAQPLVDELAREGAYDGCDRCGKAFSTVFMSCITFFQQVVAGDSWGQVTMPIIERYPLMTPFFIMVLASIEMALMNLIVAAIVDRAQEAKSQNEVLSEQIMQEEYKEMKDQLRRSFKRFDLDGTGEVSLPELLGGWDADDEFRQVFQKMDFTKDDVQMVYSQMDEDESGTVAFKEFVDHLWRVKKMDSHTMLIYIRHHTREILKQATENWHQMTVHMDKIETDLTKNTNELLDLVKQELSIIRVDHSEKFEKRSQLSDGKTPSEEKARGGHLSVESAPVSFPNPVAGGAFVPAPSPPGSVDLLEVGLREFQRKLDEEVVQLLGQFAETRVESRERSGSREAPVRSGRESRIRNQPVVRWEPPFCTITKAPSSDAIAASQAGPGPP